MAVRKRIQPSGIVEPKTAYSQGIEVSGKTMVFVAGQIAQDASGALVGEGDFRAQVVQAFENVKAVLEAVGASFDDVVKMNYYVTDINSYAVIQEVRVNYLTRPYPASTLVGNVTLVNPKALVEIEAIAVV